MSLATRIPFDVLADMDWRLLYTYEDVADEMRNGGD